MAETALARTARALDLIPYVLEHPGISLGELSTAFVTSNEQIVSDLNLLFVCGLPGYTPLELIDLTFDDGFVSVIDPQVLDRPRTFTQGEVISLKLALSALSEFPGLSVEMQAKARAMNLRLQDLLPANLTGLAAHLGITQEQIASDIREQILTIESALTSGHWLNFEYLSATSDRASRREVIPQSLTMQGEWYYLQAFVPEISENRTFRVDRISDLAMKESVTSVDSRRTDQNFEAANAEARVRVYPTGASFLDYNSAIISHRTEVDGAIDVTVSIFNEEWLIREILSFGGSCEILEPQKLVDEVRNRAQAALLNYLP